MAVRSIGEPHEAKKIAAILLLIPIFQIFCVFPSLYCHEIYNITSSQALSQGQSLVSSSQNFELGFFSPNNSANQYVGMWYKGIFPRTVVWVVDREKPITIADSAAATLMIGINGILELVNGNDKSVMWSTNIRVRSNSSIAVLPDSGNLVLNDGISGETLWQSFIIQGTHSYPEQHWVIISKLEIIMCWPLGKVTVIHDLGISLSGSQNRHHRKLSFGSMD
ncbi:Bulb-type lectin domain containing protein [Parasponia andersonii]|uniref:Bulb-type lectin domain containing protein n=1 Tax=Parasponia andersonii TaxID=3476 RepID=A0A2P5BKI5_PARAD|nr:Bulb-type lectin domain containing protein [Parasponia andersonii]